MALMDEADRELLRVLSQRFLPDRAYLRRWASVFISGICVGLLASLPAATMIVRYGP